MVGWVSKASKRGFGGRRISFLLFYTLALIRDLDNPFEYHDGKPGAADVNLEVLEHSEDRLRGLLTTMGTSA